MIAPVVTVALNPALDVTYRLGAPLVVGATNRVLEILERPGGKALNVARVLAALGVPATVVAPLGGDTGRRFAALAEAFGINGAWTAVTGETRRTVVAWYVGGSTATSLNEPGPTVSVADWDRLRTAVVAALPAPALVVSGSVAPGIPDDAIAELVAVADRHDTPTFVDTPVGLAAAVAAGATLVKPNRSELADAVGAIGDGAEELATAALRLGAGGPTVVAASDGEHGLVVVADGEGWLARAPVVAGNATGAGDATLAGLLAGFLAGHPWPEAARLGAACGAAAAGHDVAGEIGERSALDARLASITVERLTPIAPSLCEPVGVADIRPIINLREES